MLDPIIAYRSELEFTSNIMWFLGFLRERESEEIFAFLQCVQGACVMNVLDSVVHALMKDPNRKFIFAEQVCYAARVSVFASGFLHDLNLVGPRMEW